MIPNNRGCISTVFGSVDHIVYEEPINYLQLISVWSLGVKENDES